LIRLSDREVGRDIDIVYTRLRPGEKLFEELFIPGEVYGRTTHHKIFVANNGAGNAVCYADLDEAIDGLIEVAEHGDRAASVRALQRVVLEYRPADNGEEVTAESVTLGAATPHEPGLQQAPVATPG